MKYTVKSDSIFKINKFTYEEINNLMINTSYYLLRNLKDQNRTFYFEVSKKIYKVLSEQITEFKCEKGKMINGIRFAENKNLQENELKVVLI